MGKSPGKWIKNVLFGKKNSKTQLSKNVTADKKSAAKITVEDPAGDSLVISDPSENIQLVKGSSGITACATDASFPVNRDDVDSQSNSLSIPLSEAEMQRQEQAATKAQAAYRGYMARRAFRALKGIIRLQALIRGHLVRRQAVSTLHCMQAIVKLQALARGRQKGAKLVTIGADSFFQLEKLAKNVFVRKLLVSMPTTVPLSVQYDLAEPNSAWNWLERWSLSHLCESPSQTKKAPNAKPQRKSNNGQITEHDSGKSRRTIRKVSTTTNGDNNGEIASVESDKSKRNSRKITQTDSVQDPQSELERVKQNLKKVSASAAIASEKSTAPVCEKSDIDVEKPQIVTTSELDTVISSEKLADSEKPVLVEASSEKKGMDELVDVPHGENLIVETHSSDNGEKSGKTQSLNGELSLKGEESGKENQKTRKRRSLAAKHEFSENISHNTQNVPSYMLATQSAKAKLRAQGSAKIGEEGSEYNHLRRHSLPAFVNSKLPSSSPRIQKPVQANGKGGIKINKSMTPSRDAKVLQRGWRR